MIPKNRALDEPQYIHFPGYLGRKASDQQPPNPVKVPLCAALSLISVTPSHSLRGLRFAQSADGNRQELGKTLFMV